MESSTPSFTRQLAAALCAAALMHSSATAAALIVDTGAGNTTDVTGWASWGGDCDCSDSGVSGRIDVAERVTLTQVQAWMQWVDQYTDAAKLTGSLIVSVHLANGTGLDPETLQPVDGLPGTTLLSKSYSLAGTSGPQWESFDLQLELQPGSYWIQFRDSFETRPGMPGVTDQFFGRFYGGMPAPLPRYAFWYSGPELSSMFDATDRAPLIAMRVSAVPEPGSALLMACGALWIGRRVISKARRDATAA